MGYLEDRANLSGRVAVVVGGASGIGESVTLALASAGVDIAFCDINAAATTSTKARVEALGRQALAIVTDATDAAALDGFYVDAARAFRQVDILVNVVGGVSQRAFSRRGARTPPWLSWWFAPLRKRSKARRCARGHPGKD
jgi:NAD(P)-dependent dehydrogenase (short-subunit alcohol dehydrogenase family)